MVKILKVIGMVNKGSYAVVTVLTDEGDEAETYIGGSVEVYYHHGKIKAFVKKTIDN